MPTERPRINRALATGVRSIDGLLTLGEGQRVGLFAGAGCGKTTLLTAAAQWPLQAVLYLPRLGRINASVRREQNAWTIELEAELDVTARWLSGVRQHCEDRFAGALGLPVNLHLPNVDCA